jgi:hypothetical protein
MANKPQAAQLHLSAAGFAKTIMNNRKIMP